MGKPTKIAAASAAKKEEIMGSFKPTGFLEYKRETAKVLPPKVRIQSNFRERIQDPIK